MNNTNLPIYEKLIESYNSGYFWDFLDYISADVVFKTHDNFKFTGSGTFKTYFAHLGREMIKNNEHSFASLAELNNINSSNYKYHAIEGCDEKEKFPEGEIVILLRSDILMQPHSIVFLEFDDNNHVKGMYITNRFHYSYTEIKNSKTLSYFELNSLALDKAEQLYKSQGFTVKRAEIQVQTIPYLEIYGVEEYDFNVFVLADNYPFIGKLDKRIEEYLVMAGNLDYMPTKILTMQAVGNEYDKSLIKNKTNFTFDIKMNRDYGLYHYAYDIVEY